VARLSSELTRNCPKGCNGRGQCILGQCQCEIGYDGADCGQSKWGRLNKNFTSCRRVLQIEKNERKIGSLIAVAAKRLGLKLNLLASELQVMTSHLHVLTT
jgi:hypothetical protein